MATKSNAKVAAYKHVDRVEVHLWGQLAGVVALDPGYGFYAFRFTPAFQATGINLSPLQMPVGENRTFLFTDLPLETYKRLPAMLSDALPDDFGNALINRYMADRGIPAQEVTPLDRLAYMSGRAMGAMVLSQSSRSSARNTATKDFKVEPSPPSRFLTARRLIPARSASVFWSTLRSSLSVLRLCPRAASSSAWVWMDKRVLGLG